MNVRYVIATLIALATTGGTLAIEVMPKPRLVVSIAIDQLRTDYIEAYLPHYSEGGFRRLYDQGTVYSNAQYSFAPVDRASAMASLATGTSPSSNGITGNRWFNHKTLQPQCPLDDANYKGVFTADNTSPNGLVTTTLGDELKAAADMGNIVGVSGTDAIVYSIALERDAAVMGGGHAADGALWWNDENKCWASSKYYYKKTPKWLETYNLLNVGDETAKNLNEGLTQVALRCVAETGMGADDMPDLLTLTYDAALQYTSKGKLNAQQLQATYINIDRQLEHLISELETKLGKGNVLFVVTSTGYCNEQEPDYSKWGIQTGTFHIDRTANLLNMYLGALYGIDHYIDACYYNQIFLNTDLLDQKHLNIDEVIARSQSFLIQLTGVRNVYTSKDLLLTGGKAATRLHRWFYADKCGHLVVDVTPGWQLLNEENGQRQHFRESTTPFPIIFYGGGIVAQELTEPVTTDRIAPTIAKTIRIRAPNGCTATPLY